MAKNKSNKNSASPFTSPRERKAPRGQKPLQIADLQNEWLRTNMQNFDAANVETLLQVVAEKGLTVAECPVDEFGREGVGTLESYEKDTSRVKREGAKPLSSPLERVQHSHRETGLYIRPVKFLVHESGQKVQYYGLRLTATAQASPELKMQLDAAAAQHALNDPELEKFRTMDGVHYHVQSALQTGQGIGPYDIAAALEWIDDPREPAKLHIGFRAKLALAAIRKGSALSREEINAMRKAIAKDATERSGGLKQKLKIPPLATVASAPVAA